MPTLVQDCRSIQLSGVFGTIAILRVFILHGSRSRIGRHFSIGTRTLGGIKTASPAFLARIRSKSFPYHVEEAEDFSPGPLAKFYAVALWQRSHEFGHWQVPNSSSTPHN